MAMAMARGERGLEKRESSLMFVEITPPHGWKQDPQFHYLRLTLPGFEAKDITIRMDKFGRLVVRGDKQVSQHKYMSFEETFEVPNDANLEEASGAFEDEQIYCIAIPKLKDRPHVITIPHHPHKPTPIVHRLPSQTSTSKDYLKDIRGDMSTNKKVALFVAILIVLLVLIVVLIVKLRRK